MRAFVTVIVVALATPQVLPAQTTGTFLTVTLPHGVSVDVPGTWVILSHN